MLSPSFPDAGVALHQVFSVLTFQALLAVKTTRAASLPSVEIAVVGSTTFSILPVSNSVVSFPADSESHPHTKRSPNNNPHSFLFILDSIKLYTFYRLQIYTLQIISMCIY